MRDNDPMKYLRLWNKLKNYLKKETGEFIDSPTDVSYLEILKKMECLEKEKYKFIQ